MDNNTPKQSNTSIFKIITGSTLGVIIAVCLLLVCCVVMCLCFAVWGSLFSLDNYPYRSTTSVSPIIDTSKGTTKPAGDFFIGDVISLDGLNITVNSVEDFTGDIYSTPKTGYKLIAVDITVENKSNNEPSGYANPYNFAVQDSNGYSYDYNIFGQEPNLTGDTLSKGTKMRGFLTFEVPKNSAGLVLNYNPSLFGASVSIQLIPRAKG